MTDDEGMIERTALLIDDLDEEIRRELERRHARQSRLRVLDGLLDRLESLNERGARETPLALTHEVCRIALEERHALLCRPIGRLTTADWMDVVYELQLLWLLPADDRDE